MKVGIVGMPNAGKSSLFNALTRAGAEAANYPFTTIEPNVAVVPVRDPRLVAVAETVKASEIVPDTIAFHDIAGLVRGAHEGEAELAVGLLVAEEERDRRADEDPGEPDVEGQQRREPVARHVEALVDLEVLVDRGEQRHHRQQPPGATEGGPGQGDHRR